jgi:hypothetical protein
MKQTFFDFIAQHVQLTLEERTYIDQLLPIQTFSKSAFLLQEQSISRQFFFVIKD